MIVHTPPRSGPREQPRGAIAVPALEAVPRLDGVHVLAVDDEPDSLNLLRTVLEGAGATVTTRDPAAPRSMRSRCSRPTSSWPTSACRGWTVFS